MSLPRSAPVLRAIAELGVPAIARVTSLMTDAELVTQGFEAIGTGVLISRFARFYGASRIRIGSRVRIDDFAILSSGEGGVSIGDHVHIAAFANLFGTQRSRLWISAGFHAGSRLLQYR